MGEISVGETEKEYTVYFRISEEITEGSLKIAAAAEATVTSLTFAFGEARDTEPPVIDAPETLVIVPDNVTDPEILKRFILTGVTATDNIDRLYMSVWTLISAISNWNFNGKTEVTICFRQFRNRAEVKREVEFAQVRVPTSLKIPL